MKVKTKDIVRGRFVDLLIEYLSLQGEDIGRIASNSFNFPVVEGEEEAWVEILVKIPKDDEGYEKREDYELKEAEKIAKKEAAEKIKQKKIERDKKRREEKKKEEEGE